MTSQSLSRGLVLAAGALVFGAFAVATSASPAHAQITVSVAPPALRVEAHTAQPSARHIWVAGYWQYAGGQYVWAPGHWELPAATGAAWIAPRWVQSNGRWVFTAGRWATGTSVTVGVPTGTINGTVVQGTNAVGVAVLHPPTPTGTVVVQQQPVATGVITVAPPAARFERRGPPPAPGTVWITGFWQWNGTQYAWTPGRWEAPQQPGATWVAPRWQRRGRNWVFVNGEWRGGRGAVVVQQPQPNVIVQLPPPVIVQPPPPVIVQQPAPVGVEITIAPPALRAEAVPAQPSPGHVWVAGYWQWNGAQYAWTPGRWEAPQQQGATWIAPQWQRRGRGWFFVQGRWGAAERREERREDRQDRREERRNH